LLKVERTSTANLWKMPIVHQYDVWRCYRHYAGITVKTVRPWVDPSQSAQCFVSLKKQDTLPPSSLMVFVSNPFKLDTLFKQQKKEVSKKKRLAAKVLNRKNWLILGRFAMFLHASPNMAMSFGPQQISPFLAETLNARKAVWRTRPCGSSGMKCHPLVLQWGPCNAAYLAILSNALLNKPWDGIGWVGEDFL